MDSAREQPVDSEREPMGGEKVSGQCKLCDLQTVPGSDPQAVKLCEESRMGPRAVWWCKGARSEPQEVRVSKPLGMTWLGCGRLAEVGAVLTAPPLPYSLTV